MSGGARWWLAAAATTTACLTGCVEPAGQPPDEAAPSAPPAATATASASVPATPRATAVPPDDVPPVARPAARPRPTTGIVTRVVDGDTIEVDGRTVRLIGVDTPEEDACGYGRAARAMREIVLGQRVRLVAVPGRDDRDRYDRLLRYADVGGVDAGLAMIRGGLADARYDSRDGYGRHPREARYVRADARHADLGCREGAAGALLVPVLPGVDGCDPSYLGVCMPPPPPDLDCGELTISRFGVTGTDPHGFDTDGDGVACEG
jgi:endonuclease YncB( thermonuclease family)